MAEALSAYTVEKFTAGAGYVRRYRHYPVPPGVPGPLGRVVVIHGMQSHDGWYEHSCTYLSRAGFDVFFLDRRGSGMNPEARGDAPGFRRLLDDLAESSAL